ncbi:hypothetical protein [Cohnella zeiphila]|uniref:DUF4367 domain-containing protein n=1 Tax=Cohnella zeiphila TaxID=2761120 RepID=A0A7X0VW11_9BACL|nr:hypothetical protein [Cohnella zeiphila]MBB6732684.1 hypothetical protein [Cohnella zeiphila]
MLASKAIGTSKATGDKRKEQRNVASALLFGTGLEEICLLNLLSLLSLVLTMTTSSDQLDDLKEVATFKLQTLENPSYTAEIKVPYPLDPGQPVSRARIHYFDKYSQKFVFSLDEHKASGYKEMRTETIVDIRNHTTTTRMIEEDFKFIPRGKKVRINKTQAYFEPWANRETGGYLRWIQNGTYVEMESVELPEQIMVDLAKTIK